MQSAAPPAVERHARTICLSIEGSSVESLRASLPLAGVGFEPVRTCRTTVFDTPEKCLAKRGVVLGTCKVGRGWILSLHFPHVPSTGAQPDVTDVFSHADIEVPHGQAQPDLDFLDAATTQRLRDIIGDRPLEPSFSMQRKRSTAQWADGDACVEVAFESGQLAIGAARLPFNTCTLTLQRGEPVVLFDLAASLAACTPVRMDVLSTAVRGAMLAAGTWPKPWRADDLVLEADATLDSAMAVILGTSLDHFVRNLSAVDAREPEAVHQARVALRRLRTALAQFCRALPCREIALFRQQAKGVAGALGTARQWDTTIEALAGCAAFRQEDGAAALLKAAEEQRRLAYRNARTVLDGPEASRFVLGLQAFVLRRGWRNGLGAQDLPKLTQPASLFGAHEIQRLRRRVLKRGHDLVTAAPEARHDVRLACKNLRYTGEFYRSVLTGSRTAEQLRIAGQLQTLLGNFNDAVDIIGLTRSLEHGPEAVLDAAAMRAGGFVRGWFSRGAHAGEADLAKLWKRFRAAKLG